MTTHQELQNFMYEQRQSHTRVRFDGSVVYTPIPKLVCEDGFTMSVQAGSSCYSTPRTDGEREYSAYEVWLCYEPLLQDYINTYADDDGTVHSDPCGWVPTHVILDIVNKHGGLNTTQHE